jgi:hypothetical protein
LRTSAPAAGGGSPASLLGLDAALGRLALHRLDTSSMPPESHMSTTERQTAALTVALLSLTASP